MKKKGRPTRNTKANPGHANSPSRHCCHAKFPVALIPVSFSRCNLNEEKEYDGNAKKSFQRVACQKQYTIIFCLTCLDDAALKALKAVSRPNVDGSSLTNMHAEPQGLVAAPVILLIISSDAGKRRNVASSKFSLSEVVQLLKKPTDDNH